MTWSISKLYSINDKMVNTYRAAIGMTLGRGNQSTQRKPAPEPCCPPEIPHNMIWD
jgi:hypothetical protein